MKSSIQPLPSEVINLIAAGEVIDSLAAVVRELVENSIDAGATRIVVHLSPAQWRVRIADNGSGMDLLNLKLAAAAHSTSKIASCEDLWKINTLGFRGEALHSLAQLAQLEILSRRAIASEGWRVVYDTQGEAALVETVAIAPGTVVTVSNLFGTWVERRQGLPPMAQQMKAVQATIGQIALCHPHVTWQVWQNDRQWFTLCPGATTGHLLPQLIRQVRLSDLHHLKVEVPTPNCAGEQESRGAEGQGAQGAKEKSSLGIKPTGTANQTSALTLVIGLPDRCHRHRPDWVRVAVNGRMVKLPELEQTILTALARTLPRDRYPVCFLHLGIAPDQINWNRQPAKAEIYLHNLSYWQEQIQKVIDQALRLSEALLPEAVHNSRVCQLIKAAEEKGIYGTRRSIQSESEDSGVRSQEQNSSLPHSSLLTPHSLKAIAQVHNTYILAEHPAGMWLVEQHIAHERVLYEQLCDRWQLVSLESPKILNNLSFTQLSQLQRLGLEVDPFGEQVWAIRSAPAMLLDRDDCADALLELSLGGDLQTAQVAIACRCAIRNGTSLNLDQMQTLLNQWQRTRNPRTCPHGRPIYLSLEETALARFFRRNWVIGKSHGI